MTPATTGQPWRVLAALFLARAAMAFQFQAVGALAPLLMSAHAAGLDEIGWLIGLYMLPGLVLAVPGGRLGQRFGDRRVIAAAIGLMLLGAVLPLLSSGWAALVAGRLLAGIGGVILNVLMSKLVADLFAGPRLATAMGIFVTSWPVGIAAALLVLPPAAALGGLAAALLLVAAVVAAGLAVFLAGVPRPAAAAASAPGTERVPLRGAALAGALLAGGVWGLYNGALGMVFGFGPALLAERGWTPSEASAATSLALWLVALSVPAGGVLADRLQRRDAVLLGGLAVFALLLLAVPGAGAPLVVFALIGLLAGLPAGPAMSLPALVLTPATRAVGMGLFFTVFYAGIVGAPVLGGVLSERAGSAAAAFHLGAGLLAVSALCWAGLQCLAPRAQSSASR